MSQFLASQAESQEVDDTESGIVDDSVSTKSRISSKINLNRPVAKMNYFTKPNGLKDSALSRLDGEAEPKKKSKLRTKK